MWCERLTKFLSWETLNLQKQTPRVYLCSWHEPRIYSNGTKTFKSHGRYLSGSSRPISGHTYSEFEKHFSCETVLALGHLFCVQASTQMLLFTFLLCVVIKREVNGSSFPLTDFTLENFVYKHADKLWHTYIRKICFEFVKSWFSSDHVPVAIKTMRAKARVFTKSDSLPGGIFQWKKTTFKAELLPQSTKYVSPNIFQWLVRRVWKLLTFFFCGS